MSFHSVIKRPPAASARTSDKTHPFARQYAGQKEELRESPLAPMCLESLERLVDYAQHLHKKTLYADSDFREAYSLEDPGDVDVSALATAAERVLGCVQVKLAELEGDELGVGIAWALVSVQRLARQAHLEQRASRQEVKEIELKAAKGQPRTICTGTNFKISLPWWAADVLRKSEVESAALGCLTIFRDTTRASGGGNYWCSWCPDCAPSTGQRLRWWRTEIKRRHIDRAMEIRARVRGSR